MNKAISPQQLAVVPARRHAATVGPPRQASPPADSVPKPGVDRVTISASARAHHSGASGHAHGQSLHSSTSTPASATPHAAQLQQAMDGMRASFHSKAGDDNFNASFDFNSDGVINTGDLGLLREKLAGGAPIGGPQVEPPPTDDPPAPPTLAEIRGAFFTREGDENFNAAADLNGDGVVNAGDLGMFKQSMSTPVAPPTVNSDAAGVKIGSAHTTQPVPDVVETMVGTTTSVTSEPSGNTQAMSPDMESTQASNTGQNILAQLRSAFFSSQGDDRFSSALDINGDGRINVADFAAARFASSAVSEENS